MNPSRSEDLRRKIYGENLKLHSYVTYHEISEAKLVCVRA